MERHFSSIWRIMQLVMLTFAAFMAGQVSVFAAGGDSSSTGTGAWVMAYGIVLLVVTLGLIVVCKSSGRRDTSKPAGYQEMHVKKTLLHD